MVDAARPATIDASLSARMRAVASRVRSFVFVEGAAWAVAFLLGAWLIQFLLDYGTRGLQWSIRAAMLAAILAGAMLVVWRRLVNPLRRSFGEAEVANLLERRFPELSSVLISAVRFSGGQCGPPEFNSPELSASVVKQADRRASKLDFNAVVDARRAKRAGAVLIGCVGLVAIVGVAFPAILGLWFTRNVLLQEVEWPKRTELIVVLEGDELVGARGDDLAIEAYATGVQPREVEFIFETASGKRGREPMATVGSARSYRYRYIFKNAQEDFTFYLVGGDDETPEYRARLLERPRVTTTRLHIVPPVYTRLEAMTLPDGQRAARILPGSIVTIRAQTNKPVKQATLMAGRDAVAEAARDGQSLVATVAPLETHTYHFALVDEVNLENRQPVRFSLRVVSDEAPRGRMRLAGAGDMITPQAVLPIEIEFTDTYGLAAVDLIYRIAREGEVEGTIELPGFSSRMKTLSTRVDWAVSQRALVPGETVTLHVQARDFDDVSGPNVTRTPEHTLRVVTRDELLAELQRREQEYRIDFERLVDAQEDVRSGLLTAFGRAQESDDAKSLAGELTRLERRQRNIAGSVNVIRQQFEQIWSEMRVNGLDSVDERERLENRIIEPLTQLSRRDLAEAADTIRQWSREGSAERASAVDPLQVTVLSRMRAVLESMIQWEGYQEIITMLRDIIRLQQELHDETKKALEEQASDVFDD